MKTCIRALFHQIIITDSSCLIDSYYNLDLYKINNNKETIAKQTLTAVYKKGFQYKIFSFNNDVVILFVFTKKILGKWR